MFDNIFNKVFNKCNKKHKRSHFDFDLLLQKLDEIDTKLGEVKCELEYEKALLEYKIKKQDALLDAIIEVMPDMVWFKDLDGVYEVANREIRDNLLFDRSPIGKTDAEMSTNAKQRFGDDNHTFGEVCGDSDKVVKEKATNGEFNKDDGRFFEYGKIKGEMVYLEVNKAPVYIDGELIGICGTGRDMTYYYNQTQVNDNCKSCHLVANMFDRYKFVNKGHK